MQPPRFRPCCGSCRGERLVEVDDPRPAGEHLLRCLDCGARWDGAELSAAEAAQRPTPVPAVAP